MRHGFRHFYWNKYLIDIQPVYKYVTTNVYKQNKASYTLSHVLMNDIDQYDNFCTVRKQSLALRLQNLIPKWVGTYGKTM